MSRFITHAVGPCGTRVILNIEGNSVNKVVSTINKTSEYRRLVKNCELFLLYNRQTGKLTATRFN